DAVGAVLQRTQGCFTLEAVPEELAVCTPRPLPHLVDEVRVRGANGAAARHRADQGTGVEPAGLPVADDAVGHAITCVAGRDRRLRRRGELARWDDVAGQSHLQLAPELGRV